MALADLGANINLMLLYVWKKLMLLKLVPTRMTLELANRSISYPTSIAEDVFVQVGKFTFPADFFVVDYDVDPRVPLILGRLILRTARALVDVYREELILRDDDETLIFHADSTLKYPHKHGDDPTPPSDLVVKSLSPSLTPFGDINFLLEKTDAFLSLDDSIPPDIDNEIYDSEGDILFLEELLNGEILRDLPPKELKEDKLKMTKSSIKKPPGLIMKFLILREIFFFLEELLNDEILKDHPPLDLNNDPQRDILFLKNLLKDEPSETKRYEIYILIREPPNTFYWGTRKSNSILFKDIDDPILILRVSETPLDSFDSSLDSFDTDSDASKTKTIMDEVQIDNLQSTAQIPPLFEALISDMTMHDITLYLIFHGMIYSSCSSFYLGLLFPEGVSKSHSLDSFELGDENVVFDPRTLIIKGWIKHSHGGDIPAMDVPYLHFSPKDK
nr:hypothetical protein [Tanacetum cinerariifolium]